jgi:hypothetical protein
MQERWVGSIMPELLLVEQMKQLKRFNADINWFQKHYPTIKKRYKGQYVAVRDLKIIDHDKDGDLLLKRLKKRGIDTSSVAVEFVSDKKYQLVL